MSLKIPVIVSEINNLSDARYCAGMGVDLLGFSFDENHPKYVTTLKFQEIVNWISGIKVVGEFSGNNVAYINQLAEQLNLDYVQLDLGKMDIHQLIEIEKPIILKADVNINTVPEIIKISETVNHKVNFLYFEITDNDPEKVALIKGMGLKIPLILGVPYNLVILEALIEEIRPYGINLKGGLELKPGFKDFTDLSEILEYLEESN